MLGNWAIGSRISVTTPTITVTMAMTMATIGRLIKNLDIGSPAFSRSDQSGFHYNAVPGFLHALNDDPLARLQTFLDNPHLSRLLSDLHRPDADFVVVSDDS